MGGEDQAGGCPQPAAWQREVISMSVFTQESGRAWELVVHCRGTRNPASG